jgi:hypothetical protein
MKREPLPCNAWAQLTWQDDCKRDAWLPWGAWVQLSADAFSWWTGDWDNRRWVS